MTAAISLYLLNIRNSWYKFLLKINIYLCQQLLSMKQFVCLKYFHPGLNIGLEDIRNAWLISEKHTPVLLKTIIHQGRLHYRLPVSGKRISYRTLKKGLINKKITLQLPFNILPF